MPKAINISRPCYTMASPDGQTAEITMYGDIVESWPTDWWTGERLEGSYITQDDFIADLETISNASDITIRMNSCGGDAGVSIVIHNRLRELANKGAKLTCIVDGVAMSGGSLIMCACDTVKVNPASLVMIHKCWSFLFGGYNADELRQEADQRDAWDKAQVSIYKRKTSLSDAVISHMMSDTTYMTGKEAVEKGFANELLEDAEPVNIAASADGRSLFVKGRQMHLTPGMFAPDIIPTVTSEEKPPVEANKNQPAQPGSQEGGSTPMANTIEELRTEYPELTAQLEADARAAAGTADIQTERARLQEIDEVSALFDSALVQEAKYGQTACSAQELAYRAAKNAAKQGQKFMTDLEKDAQASGSGKVGAAPNSDRDDEPKTPEQYMAAGRAAVKAEKKED